MWQGTIPTLPINKLGGGPSRSLFGVSSPQGAPVTSDKQQAPHEGDKSEMFLSAPDSVTVSVLVCYLSSSLAARSPFLPCEPTML